MNQAQLRSYWVTSYSATASPIDVESKRVEFGNHVDAYRAASRNWRTQQFELVRVVATCGGYSDQVLLHLWQKSAVYDPVPLLKEGEWLVGGPGFADLFTDHYNLPLNAEAYRIHLFGKVHNQGVIGCDDTVLTTLTKVSTSGFVDVGRLLGAKFTHLNELHVRKGVADFKLDPYFEQRST